MKKKKVLPLLLLHGWPGSVREFYDFIPILNEPAEMSDYVFEVVAPSLVGYGWSQVFLDNYTFFFKYILKYFTIFSLLVKLV